MALANSDHLAVFPVPSVYCAPISLQEPSKRLGSFDFLASNLHWSTMSEEENYA